MPLTKVQTEMAGTGSVLQVVNASSTTYVTTTSTSLVTTGFSASITPKSATSKILVVTNSPLFHSSTGQWIKLGIYRNATAITSTTGYTSYTSNSSLGVVVPVIVTDSPATTSATTYTIYFSTTAGTVEYCGNSTGGIPATITLMEIAA